VERETSLELATFSLEG